MSYNEEERAEEMETELREDNIREKANEIDDGSFETWCKENNSDLVGEFAKDNDEVFKDYCKQSWKEYCEGLI